MPRYVSTFRAVYDASDDVEAMIIADQIRANGEVDLDEDEGDTFECTQTTSNTLEIQPAESLTILRKARNLLIKTRIKQCFIQARELDQMIYALQFRDAPEFTMAGYSYGDFMDLTSRILTLGEEPDVG